MLAAGCRLLAKAGPHSAEDSKEPQFEDIRAILAVKTNEGKLDEVRALLQRYDARKLSQVKPEDYKALLRDAEAL